MFPFIPAYIQAKPVNCLMYWLQFYLYV